MKECFKERPHTGHCREKTGGGGEKKCLSGKGGGRQGRVQPAGGSQVDPLQDASQSAESERRLPWDTGGGEGGNQDRGLQRRGRAEAGSPPSTTQGKRWANRGIWGLPGAKRRGQASY